MAMRNNNHSSIIAMRIALVMSIALAIIMVALLFPSPPAHAKDINGTGRIFGQLLDGTKKNTPLAGQSVILQVAQGSSAADLASVTTDAHGSYSFTHLSTGKTTSYALYIHYQGAQYTSNIIALDTRSVQQVNLTVYEATKSTANMAIVRSTILLHKPDAQKGIVSVSALIIFRNLNTRTYVGSLDASSGKPNALRFSLPHTARNVTLGKGFDGYQAIQVDRGFASNAAVPPGDSQFAFTFDIPYTTSNYDFDYTIVYPTVQLTMLVPVEIHASSDTLASQGPVTADQNTFNLLQANALLANKQIHVQLEGLPALVPVSNSPAPAFNPWLIIILLIMAVILSGTWLLYRSARRSSSKKKRSQQKQHTQQQAKSADMPTKADKTAGSEEEQALLQELLELDKSFEAGKLTKSLYQERRTKTKARLRALMREKVTS